MNVLSLSVFSTISAGPLPAPAVLTIAPNWSYSANDHILSAAVSFERSFIAAFLPNRSFIEDTVAFPHWRSGSGRGAQNPETMKASLQKES